jgi:hypothetical protein
MLPDLSDYRHDTGQLEIADRNRRSLFPPFSAPEFRSAPPDVAVDEGISRPLHLEKWLIARIAGIGEKICLGGELKASLQQLTAQ